MPEALTKEHEPAMSSTKKKRTSMTRRTVILAERDRLMTTQAQEGKEIALETRLQSGFVSISSLAWIACNTMLLQRIGMILSDVSVTLISQRDEMEVPYFMIQRLSSDQATMLM